MRAPLLWEGAGHRLWLRPILNAPDELGQGPFADSGWPGAEDAERREPARLAVSGGKPAWPALHHRRQLITY
mgnify:CR=1 FL=1